MKQTTELKLYGEDIETRIVYRDDDLIAVNKPPGMLCVPGLSEPCNLYDWVKTRFANARVVHRLDMATSGLVLFALHHEAQKRLGQLFEHRKIKKRYRARVHGVLRARCGEICAPLLTDWPRRPRQKIDWHGGKTALTTFAVLSRDPIQNSTLLALSPYTGRSHQLRVHMLFIGHPIIGDRLYSHTPNTQNLDTEGRHMHLHAERLEFRQPFSKGLLRVDCPAEFF